MPASTHPLATGSAPFCPPPLAEMHKPSFAVPAGACDTHAHVIGDGVKYPFVATRGYTPPPASEADYIRMLDGLGIDRGVLVQVSVHGTDNSLMLETMRKHPKRLRGVAVSAPDVSDVELKAMNEAGVRGLRLNVAIGGGIGFDALEPLAKRIAPMGWHLQFLTTAARMAEVAPRLPGLPVDVVIDHMAYVRPYEGGVNNPAFKAMLKLLEGGRTWIKISGAYRNSSQQSGFTDVDPIARALIAARPDRLVWGSDWPHVHFDKPMLPTPSTLDILGRWTSDAGVVKRILVDNPAALYQF